MIERIALPRSRRRMHFGVTGVIGIEVVALRGES